jgi:hypothetical protein
LEEIETLEEIVAGLKEEIHVLNSDNHRLCDDIDIVLNGNEEFKTVLEEKVKNQQKLIGLLEKKVEVQLDKNERNLAHLYEKLFEERLKRLSLIDSKAAKDLIHTTGTISPNLGSRRLSLPRSKSVSTFSSKSLDKPSFPGSARVL